MNINQVWPEWNEECVLGEGSFGKVYRAKRVEYGRTFYSAIKVLTVPKSHQEIKYARSQGMNDEEIYGYFRGVVDNLLNEITLMDNLKGAQNIVGIEDYKIVEHEGEVGWDIFIRMELLTPFDSFVSNPEFSQKDVIRLGVDICSALEICEQNCIVHRDIKPDNIFISRFGEYKLGDFGIARRLEGTRANLSRKGTLNYMAPEIYKSEEYGSNVDIYSLGLVLYTLLNNNRIAFLPPYPQPISYSDNEDALGKRLSGEPIISPCNASASLSNVIIKACAYNPKDRYQSATEFKNSLINEWNIIVQSGDNREIGSDSIRFGMNLDKKFESTTNDMTANGRLVVNRYAEDTTTLEEYGNAQVFMKAQQVEGAQVFDETMVMEPDLFTSDKRLDVAIPEGYSTARSSKLCKILAYPPAIGALVWLFVSEGTVVVLDFLHNFSNAEGGLATSFLGIALCILLADHNKRTIGICVSGMSFAYIVDGLSCLLREASQPIAPIITFIMGLLILFAGIVITTQKEVRFGGSLCIYALVLKALHIIYQLVNETMEVFSLSNRDILTFAALLTVFIWSYGYKSDEKLKGFRKLLYFVTYFIAVAVTVGTIFFVYNLVRGLL